MDINWSGCSKGHLIPIGLHRDFGFLMCDLFDDDCAYMISICSTEQPEKFIFLLDSMPRWSCFCWTWCIALKMPVPFYHQFNCVGDIHRPCAFFKKGLLRERQQDTSGFPRLIVDQEFFVFSYWLLPKWCLLKNTGKEPRFIGQSIILTV